MKKYWEPEFRSLGSLAGLTMGSGGSCSDGPGTNDQLGGGHGGVDACGVQEDEEGQT